MTSEAHAEDPPATLRAIQVRNYRSLRHIDLRFDGNFYVLVGPNGSGKSTLLDAIAFLTDYVQQGLERAVRKRTRNFQDLVWGRPAKSPGFELAAEFALGAQALRYELRIEESGEGVAVAHENGYLARLTSEEFSASAGSGSIVQTSGRKPLQVFGRDGSGTRTWFRPENYGGDEVEVAHLLDEDSAIGFLSMLHGFSLGGKGKIDLSALKRITDTLKQGGVQCLQLDSRKLRQASRSNGDDGSRLANDGGNLPRVLEKLKSDPKEWERWFEFVRLALPELEEIRIVHREDDRHDYLMVRRAGVEVPSWGVSEGTLRLFALTAIAHLRAFPMAYLLKEPENGIHPMAIEFACQALSAVCGAQVFIASHSPTLLRCVETDQVLCFGHNPERGTVIVPGGEHPRLRDWQRSVDDNVLWAADVLS